MGPLTKAEGLNTKKILEGLGPSPEEIRELRGRLSSVNTAGFQLAGAGAARLPRVAASRRAAGRGRVAHDDQSRRPAGRERRHQAAAEVEATQPAAEAWAEPSRRQLVAVTDFAGAGRVLIALAAGRCGRADVDALRQPHRCRCYGFDCYAGRQSELDTTDTGTATVYFHDQDGHARRRRSRRAADHAAVVQPRHRRRGRSAGAVTSTRSTATSSTRRALRSPTRALHCVGIFDYLGGVKMLPGCSAMSRVALRRRRLLRGRTGRRPDHRAAH